MDSELRRATRVPAEAAYAWFTDFNDSDLLIQRSLRSQTVRRTGPGDLVVERRLDLGRGPLEVRLEIHLCPKVAYDVRVHSGTGAFDMTFAFAPARAGSDIVVTVRDAAGTPAADPEFRAGVLRSVAANLDDYVPAMEKELE